MEKKIPIVTPTLAVITGTSVTFTFPPSITAVELGESFKIPAVLAQLLGTTVGTEEVIISVGASTYALVDNLGVIITSQMLRRAIEDRDGIRAPFYFVQVGLSGTDTVFYGRRGFYPRRTTAAVVTPPAAI